MNYCMWSFKNGRYLLNDVHTHNTIATASPSYTYPGKWMAEIHLHRVGDSHNFAGFYESGHVAIQTIIGMLRDYGYLIVKDKHKSFI